MKLFAFDIGEKRIGIAKTDELGIGVWPVETYLRKDLPSDFQHLLEVIQEHAIEKVIVGYPYHQNGRPSAQGAKIKQFTLAFERFLAREKKRVSLEFYDERLTSFAAEDALKGYKKKQKRKHLDAIAACLLLEDYLSHFSSKNF